MPDTKNMEFIFGKWSVSDDVVSSLRNHDIDLAKEVESTILNKICELIETSRQLEQERLVNES